MSDWSIGFQVSLTHAANAVTKCARCDTLASLLFATDLLFLLQNSFVFFPSSENTQKHKAAIFEALFYSYLSGVESNAQIKRVQVTFSWSSQVLSDV